MGRIKGLEKYCISNNAITEEIDIRDEIAKWLREHGENPTIIIDVKELNRVLGDRYSLHSFADVLNLGGQFWKFNEILDYFFGEMKKAGANLMFIARLNESRFKEMNEWEKSTLHPNERLLYNLMQICSKYGRLSVNYGLGKSSVLAYARQYRDQVMALITRNTKYLVYDIDFSYWCLVNVDFYQLKIVNISPKQMLRNLALNTKQMQLIFALSMLESKVKFRLVERKCDKFWRMVQFVEPFRYGEKGFDLNALAYNLTKQERDDLEDKLNRIFAINDYAGNWNEDIYEGLILDLANNEESFNLVLQFCKENLYFAYKLINEKDSTQKDLLCIEYRHKEDVIFGNVIVIIMRKMCGILFKDVNPKKRPAIRTVQTNQHLGAIFVTSVRDIIYPTSENFPSHSNVYTENSCAIAESRRIVG
ncbi:uncharacterized protein LOC129569464 [Sitodiplosis mosellana]|uniref:uncharacterized protein LOC129569464 n=1 Tax=Sitodiplosis mosellana TaxID=263140 RepID=UPI0024445886|nr:uncharacterized protein LOC129569464 [Sitodiplosis mosellana]